ncbi:uncharacterized protein LOC117808220 isoform X1 [Notolabrus celidotus]|uniref:uncharacterized protein LOC117808220 isoform X1 n=1 Tax=Notolabrus celidotus TaxID=1203425 RepID=UPI001490244C|nr:uncharacterized protein LOC117808220 isoform X1 [Notolabrus celidotus]XP_034533708.1 uncharacterized protein LOC117808220 isoform X1 [Notolabrus celidotus]
MACTSQSALEYVRSARRQLVNELKDLSVILENLYQEEVFCDEEVINIEAERHDYDKARKTLDSVIKKGEAACYKFLRIIDVTRKRTLGRTSSLPEKTTEASPESQRFNLLYWISCYPFKEDADMYRGCLQGPRSCHTYQTKLKTRARKKSTTFWMRNQKLFDKNNKPDLCYSPLVLDTQGSGSLSKIKKFKNKKSKMSRPKKLRTYLPEDKPNISPSDLLKTDKNILLVGKPGIGKTALGHEILKLWAERESKELDYMFYFDMRETSLITEGMSLEELLFSVYSEPDEGKAEVLQDIKNHSDNVTVILDGVTDLSSSVVKRIVENEILPNAKVIITCRPDDEEEDFLCGDFLRVEVKGFSEQTIQNYFSTILGEEHRKILSQLELLTLCHVPMYALMVAACVLSETTGDSPEPCSMTEIYINIVRFCLQTSSNKSNKHLSSFIQEKKEEILSLAECAFHATQRKTVNLTDFQCEDSCVLSFLKPLVVKVAPTKTKTTYAFLHYTVQEFYAALWLLRNPNQIKDVFQQCLTEERKHMKHLIPFMSRLLTEKSPSLMEHLIPAQELKSTAHWFFKELINTFDSVSTEGSGLDMDLLFFCQCLYESQCPDLCVYFLETLDYHLDLSGESLDSYLCCAVASVVALSKDRKVRLNLEDVSVSEQGMRRLFECLDNVQWCDSLPQQLWKIVFSEGQFQEVRLLSHDGNQFHLPLQGKTQLFERAVNIIQKNPNKVDVCLHWDSRETTFCPSLSESLLEALPRIRSLSFRVTDKGPGLQDPSQGTLEDRVKKKLFMDLCLKAALHKKLSLQDVVQRLMMLFSVGDKHELILDLYQHIQSEGCLSVLPKLRRFFDSAPKVWSIDLSKRKTSILLEVLKLQSQKKPVKLRGCLYEESEVRSLLQCLPFMSQLSFSKEFEGGVKLCGSLICAAAERDQQTGENTLELLSSVCTYQTFPLHKTESSDFYQRDFLLDLCSYMKDYETKTGLRVLPSLQSVFQSAPKVWSIDLSKRKTSILLEVLKLQSQKKPVKLRGCLYEESEVRSLLQCLPFMSQLSFSEEFKGGVKLCGSLFCAAAERDQQTGENTLELLSSVCTYQTFPLHETRSSDFYQSSFLLDLFSYMKDYETKTGLRVLPSLQSVFQSVPKVWSIDLSKRKTSILLEVLKLQSQKKPVEVYDWSDEESEVRSLLQCLPFMSQLSFSKEFKGGVQMCGSLFCAAAERDQQTGENTLELLSSVCTYQTFPLHETRSSDFYQSSFLLDLCSYMKDYETKTGLRVLPSLQSVFQSVPEVWSIDLSKRKTSILLEVLKLQSQKKPVELRGCSYKESEVRSLLQCLPFMSQLSFSGEFQGGVKLCGSLFCAAAERDQQTGENTLELLSSVCTYQTFPLHITDEFDDYHDFQCDFLLDLFSYMKDYETQTGLRVLPSLQSVFQSVPEVWSIVLSERETSILLEVLKLQSQKKPVEVYDWSDEESEVRSLLQCLPFISQLSFSGEFQGGVKLCGSLICAAAERDQQTGENTLELLSSVCTYQTFPLHKTEFFYDFEDYQSSFLLDLCSYMKDYETKTGLRVLPSLQSVFQSTPEVWSIDLSKRKTSILLEVLKLQSQKKPVELRGWSYEESEVRSLLQCLPFISQLSCDPKFFQCVCASMSVRSREEAEQLVSLLQLIGFSFSLTGELRSKTCDTIGRVLGLCGSNVDLILTPRRISVRGASLLFRHTTKLHSLSLSSDMALLLSGWVRRNRVARLSVTEELSLSSQTLQPSERVLLRVVSSLASLLRYWTIRRLDLTESRIPAQGLIPLLLHDGPLTIKLSEKISELVLVFLYEIQDKDLTRSFLSKINGDLTPVCLNWEHLHHLLQSAPQTVTVNLRKNRFLQESITRLLPFLDRVVFKRPSPLFVLTAIREIHKTRASSIIPSLLRSFDHVINLTCREMEPEDCAPLLYTLRHGDGVKLNLLWTSIPTEEINSILFTLDRVSRLSVDRNLLLRIVHCCAASDAQQERAVSLLRTLEHRLDLSCSSQVNLSEGGQSETLCLTTADCRAISTILRYNSKDTELQLQDCEVEDSGLVLLFPVLDRVHLRASKDVLLQLMFLVPSFTERDSVSRAKSLCGVLGGELDFSHTKLDERACEALALVLDFTEELTELDLSHCQITDQLLSTLITYLNKAQVLDLSHNNITDASTSMLLRLISINPCLQTVRLFRNNIMDQTPFKTYKQFEIW